MRVAACVVACVSATPPISLGSMQDKDKRRGFVRVVAAGDPRVDLA